MSHRRRRDEVRFDLFCSDLHQPVFLPSGKCIWKPSKVFHFVLRVFTFSKHALERERSVELKFIRSTPQGFRKAGDKFCQL